VGVVAAAIGTVATVAQPVVESTCDLSELRPITLGQNSFVYAGNGSLLGAIPSEKDRQPITLKQMSPWVPKATVAIEDRRFYRHGALDYQGIIRAAIADLTAGHVVQGGSTLTQQLVRNLYIGSDQQTLSRKIKEACLSLRLAQQWSKSKILQTYMNQVYYGNRAYGVEAAAQTYYSKSADELTLAQAALIAGLPQAPTLYDPFKRPQTALARRNDVLSALLETGNVSQPVFRKATRTPLGLKPGKLYTTIKEPVFFDYIRDRLINTYGPQRVRSGGLAIHTTLSTRLQAVAGRVIRDHLRVKTDPAAALVAIDPSSGAVRAMAAYAPGKKNLQFNLAFQGHRQAGSSFKPFTLAAAMQQRISLSSIWNGPPVLSIPDPACSFNGQPWEVHNYADEAAGSMSLLDATAHSVNTIFAQLVTKVTPEKVAEVAHAMGITSPLAPVCSITLGTQPVAPLEMADAFGTLAAQGIHHPAQPFMSVTSPSGRVLARLTRRGTRALAANDANLVTFALQGVVQHGTGVAANIGRPAAGKTGTAENFQDAWFCGFVPQLVTCVWVGYPQAEIPMYGIEGFPSVFGGSIPAGIWHDFMSVAVANLPVESFPVPSFAGYDVFPKGTGRPGQIITGTSGATTTAKPTTTQPPPTTTPTTTTVVTTTVPVTTTTP